MKKIISFLLISFCYFAFSKDEVKTEEINPYLVEEIHVLTINSTINPATLNYLESHLKTSQNYKRLYLVKMNTPGGLVTTTKDILTLMGESSHPIVIWITPEGASATSAGAIIASGSHFLFMNDGTNIGAATPIGLGEDIKESDARNKAIKDLVALVRSLSELRGRNADAFASMIEKAESYSSQDALKKNIVNANAQSLNQVREYIEGKEIPIKGVKSKITFAPILDIKEIDMDLGQKLLNILAHPTTAYILFIMGAALLYFEFQAPGGFVSGSIGAILLVMAGIGFQVLPLNFGAISLMIAGIILLILEVFITSYGALSAGGIAALVAGSLFLFRTENSFMTIEYRFIFSTLFGIIFFVAIIGWYFWKQLKLQKKEHFFDVNNQTGSVLKVLGPNLYQIKVAGSIWKAESSEQLVNGDSVIVEKQTDNNLMLKIRKLTRST